MAVTDEPTTDQVATVVDAYFDALNETDPTRRAGLLAQAFVDDGAFRDPLADLVGAEQIGAMLDAAHEAYPGQVFRRTSGIDGHHDVRRFEWNLGPADGVGDLVVAGIDIVELAPDGRIACVTGFFGPFPDLEA